MSALEWFKPAPIDLEDLAILGVTQREAEGNPYAHLDDETGAVLVLVGTVIMYDDDSIVVWPRKRITGLAMRALHTTAEDALRGKLEGSWTEHERRDGVAYRQSMVWVRANGWPPFAAALRAATFADLGDPYDNAQRRRIQDSTTESGGSGWLEGRP